MGGSTAAAGAVAGAVATSAAAAKALAVIGPVIIVEPREFEKVVALKEKPIVVEVVGKEGILSRRIVYVYVANVDGLTFMTKSYERLRLRHAYIVSGRRLALPPIIRQYL